MAATYRRVAPSIARVREGLGFEIVHACGHLRNVGGFSRACDKPIRRLLRFRCRGEDSARVGLEYLQPRIDVLRMILPRVCAESQVCAGQRSPKLADQLFSSVRVIAETLPQLPVTAGRWCRPVGVLMGESR